MKAYGSKIESSAINSNFTLNIHFDYFITVTTTTMVPLKYFDPVLEQG